WESMLQSALRIPASKTFLMPPSVSNAKSKQKPAKPVAAAKATPETGTDRFLPYAIGLVALAVIAYLHSLTGKFIFDDQQIVMQNPRLMNVRSLSDVVSMAAGWRQL